MHNLKRKISRNRNQPAPTPGRPDGTGERAGGVSKRRSVTGGEQLSSEHRQPEDSSPGARLHCRYGPQSRHPGAGLHSASLCLADDYRNLIAYPPRRGRSREIRLNFWPRLNLHTKSVWRPSVPGVPVEGAGKRSRPAPLGRGPELPNLCVRAR